MFKKMRNKLLLTNMLIITALMLGSFSVIYIITSQNVYREINRELNGALSVMPRQPQHPRRDNPPPNGNRLPNDIEQPPAEQDVMRDKDDPFVPNAPFASILKFFIDSDGVISERNNSMTITDEELLNTIKTEALTLASSGANSGNVEIGGTTWDYKIDMFENGTAIVIGDFSSEYDILKKLIIILSLVGLGAALLTFFVSLISANSSIRPVEESYNKQKQFIADASHELKTPLTTINTNIDVLLAHENCLIKDEKKWLLYIKGESERMAKLTNDLLYLAQFDHSENVIYSRISFSDVVQSVILTTEAVAFEKNIFIDDDIAENINVLASPDQLKQLILILIDNAVKYTPPGGRIDISLQKPAVFKIRNTGEGISESDMKMIFERFYRSDKSRNRDSGGYGLGLSIAKAITQSFKGEIAVSSSKGEYTEFTVSLPADNSQHSA